MEHIPEIKVLSKQIDGPVKESLELQILRHCEEILKPTINKDDLTNAILKTCQENSIVVPSEQTQAFVDMVYQSAGNDKDIYRIVLKKAIIDNIDNLILMEKGQLV